MSLSSILGGHLQRLGGVIVSPRRTLRALLWQGEGRMWEVVLWLVVVTATVAPTRAGRAALIGRTSLLDGAQMFLSAVANRMLAPLLGLVIAASILHLLDRVLREGPPAVPFDVALDACAFTLVPFLALASLGAGLSALGVEVGVLPHRRLDAPPWIGPTRVALGFFWTFALYGGLLQEVYVRAKTSRGGADPDHRT